ncbi:hypothetical protein DPMN_003983 [Dreissena polymorpha]|uniref:Uncharacterized protein n=1 Tax=Dreissena polymorpha TaxID=45954 RepID=A0A9D4MPG3_DREPO|nr:hypothetical protein DPMN_003983 [Dreissena polymorpha]
MPVGSTVAGSKIFHGSEKLGGDCDRGLSTMKRVDNCSRLKSAVLNALMVVSIKGQNEAVDFGRLVDVWHQEKSQRTVFVLT